MEKKGGQIYLIAIILGLLCLITASIVTVSSQKNNNSVYESPLFTLRTQRAINGEVEFSVDYIAKEQDDVLGLFNVPSLQEITEIKQIQNENTWNICGPLTWISTCDTTCTNTCLSTCSDTCSSTCSDTCSSTCSDTCSSTCWDTCRYTCSGNTCYSTCSNTCGYTCQNTCSYTCGYTCDTCDIWQSCYFCPFTSNC